jgi:hypothetical protein
MARFEPSPHKEEAMEALRNGVTKEECAKRFGITIRTAERYLQEIQHPKPPPVSKPPKIETVVVGSKQTAKPAAGPTPLAVVATITPAPVVLTIGQQKIDLDPQALYESFLVYEDTKIRCGLQCSFSSFLQDGVGLLWRVLATEPRIIQGKVQPEVNNGRSTGSGEAEIRAG